VDIRETLSCLLGLHVQTWQMYDDGRRYRVYRGQIDHREVVVIWRETEDWGKKDLERDKKFVVERKLTEGPDELFVNGDSFIPNAKALEPVLKARMFAPVEVGSCKSILTGTQWLRFANDIGFESWPSSVRCFGMTSGRKATWTCLWNSSRTRASA